MKKTLVLAALTLVSASAFASKTRLANLSSAAHLKDTADVLSKPDQALVHGEWASFTWGQKMYNNTAAAADSSGLAAFSGQTGKAAGGFVRMNGDSAWGFYLGNQNDSLNNSRAVTTPSVNTQLLNAENPWNVFYAAKSGDMTWGAGMFYSSSANAASKLTQSAMSLNGSMTMGAWDANLTLGLGNSATNNTNTGSEIKLAGKSTMALNVGYTMDSMYVYGGTASGGYKKDTGSATSADTATSSMTLGVVNSHKKDGTDFFYGASYVSTSSKDAQAAASDVTAVRMPVIIGVESEAASWLVLRASVTQNVLMGSTKVGTADDSGVRGNNTVKAGAGLKFNKWTMDGSFTNASAATTALGTDANFITDLSMSYKF